MNGKDYRITPPPAESGDEPLFRVIYVIDVPAGSAQDAALEAWHMMRDKDAFDPVFVVLDSKGRQTKLDLMDLLEFHKVISGFVSQRYRRQRDGGFACIDQEFVAGDPVQYENVQGDPINPPEHEYQPFNMTLLSSPQIIDRVKNVLMSIDVGGEQSRQFADEIGKLKSLLQDLSPTKLT